MIHLIFSLFLGWAVHAQALSTESNNFTSLKNLRGSKTLSTEEGYSFSVQKKNSRGALEQDGTSLIVGYPLALIGESSTFGGVVIKVSETEDTNYGDLKLGSVIGFVRTELEEKTTGSRLLLRGAFGEHAEKTPLENTLVIPVEKVDRASSQVYLDFSALGSQLDIAERIQKNDPESGEAYKEFKLLASRTVAVDYSVKTLTFDVESDYMVGEKKITLTVRWFMRLGSASSPFFVVRSNTEGVGFFQTHYNSDQAPIARFAISDLQRQPIKYYVKAVPTIWKNAFASAILDWNHKLQSTLGYDLLSFEFLDQGDPRYDQIVTGDPRFNVIEWDLVNKASYGGLGPNLPNPMTGEVLSAQTLIQGPTIEELYTKWFGVDNPNKKNQSVLKKEFKIQFSKANFRIPAQDPRLQDRLETAEAKDFVELPTDYNYESYMNGYFRDMVSHELGHNLGLRHNFKGSLADDDTARVGSASWSVMEYLPRLRRHLSRVGEYDVMAIAYGYLGVEPARKDQYCTDENSNSLDPANSAECSSSDATTDSYAYFKNRMDRGIDFLLNRGTALAPTWTAEELKVYLPDFMTNLATYFTTAEKTSSTWVQFFKGEDRQALVGRSSAEVRGFVLKDLNLFLCDPTLDAAIELKVDEAAKVATRNNLTEYRKFMFEALKEIKTDSALVTTENFSCYKE